MPKARNILQDIFASLADLRPKFTVSADERSIETLSTDLLSGNDETSIQRLGRRILGTYEMLSDDEKHGFFSCLVTEMDLDIGAIINHAGTYQKSQNAKHLAALLKSAEPRRQEFLRRLNQVSGATQILVAMRADLLRFARQDDRLKIADLDFVHLFTSWFNRGFLELKPISWQTPANILGKIIKYEAVHAIDDWDDLRRRLQPTDRRCFAFFHPAMPEEPLVFVEVALCKGIPSSIQTVLAERDNSLPSDEVDTAAFYSISNCQSGLQGISFGNALIKQVVEDLSKEIPKLQNFVTLSPLPDFAKWLKSKQDALPPETLNSLEQACQTAIATGDMSSLQSFDDLLCSLGAQYLMTAKRSDGQPLDPVARFHLRNGATIHAIHSLADISQNGSKNAFGLMVNYRYELAHVAKRHENYVRDNEIEFSKQISNLASVKQNSRFG